MINYIIILSIIFLLFYIEG